MPETTWRQEIIDAEPLLYAAVANAPDAEFDRFHAEIEAEKRRHEADVATWDRRLRAGRSASQRDR